jgi:MFS family permease
LKPETVSNPVRPWTVLAQKNFALFWSSLLVSAIGSQLTSVAIAWQVYELTDSPLQLGLTGLFRAVPLIAFAFTGGWLADRVERRRLLLATQVLALFLSLSLGLLTDSGHIDVWHIYAILFAQSALMSFDLPTRNALIPNLVVEEHLATAFGLSVALRQAAFLAGPFVAGAIIAYGGVRWCYYIDAASFLAVIVCLALIEIRGAPQPSRERGLRSMLQGLSFIRRNRMIFALLVMDAAVNFFGAFRGLMPVFARDLLNVGPTGLGALFGAPAVGAIAGSLVVMMLGDPRSKARLIVTVTLLYSAGVVAFALSRSFMLSLAICFVLGALDAVGETLRMTVIQLMTPDELRGRVQAASYVFLIGGPFLGQAEIGFAASLLGATGAVVLGGVLATAAVAAMAKTVIRSDKAGERREA